MSNIVTIGYTAEGNTDKRFLEAIIKRTFEQIAFECDGLIEVYDPIYIDFVKKDGFLMGVEKLASHAFSIGISILCVHTDADAVNDAIIFQNKIIPAFHNIEQANRQDLCNNLVAIVPVRMSEAWMLSDKQLLKEEIGTDLSDQDLGMTRPPESIADPKAFINNVLRIAQEDIPRRRKKITISEIYQPIGQNVSLEKLETQASYLKFKNAVRAAFIKLNYLQ